GPAVGARPRRPAVGPRRAHRGAGRDGVARGARRDHRARRGAPAVDGAAGRPGRAAGGRPDQRDRHALPAAGRGARLPRPAGPGERAGAAVSDDRNWRGVATEDAEELPVGAGVFLRDRSRRLLGELVRPHRRSLWGLLATITTQNVAWLAGPFLIGVGIDVGVPALVDHGNVWP